MTDTERLPTDANDAELISRVRGGDVDAYGELFSRHVDAATRLARTLAGSADADDLVSESFVKVLNVLLGGGGPDIAFRAYLLTAVRRLHVDRIRATRKATPIDDLTPYDPGIPFRDTVISGFEGGAAARAFASLPERWQMVLWHLEVEGQKPADVAPLLGMSANSVSALAYRAREGLRQAFLQMHTADLVEENCRWTHDKIGAYVRKGLSRRDHDKVERHLDECRRCTAIYLELAELNTSLAAVIGPLVLGGAAAAYLAGTAAGAGGLVGVGALLGRARDVLVGNSQAAIAVGAAAGVAAVATAGFLVLQGHPKARTLVVSDPAIAAPSIAAPGSSPPTQQPDHQAGHRQHRTTNHRSTTTTQSVTQVQLTTPSATPSTTPSAAAVTVTTTPSPSPGTQLTSVPTGQPTATQPPTTQPPTDTASPSPSSSPTDSGTPSPTPTNSGTPSPTPTDSGTPSPTPTDSGSPNPPPTDPTPTDNGNPSSADVSLTADVTTDALGISTITAMVQGIPSGATAELSVSANGLAKLQGPLQTNCQIGAKDNTIVCQVRPDTGRMWWAVVHPLQGLQLSIDVTAAVAADGSVYPDPDDSNNHYSP